MRSYICGSECFGHLAASHRILTLWHSIHLRKLVALDPVVIGLWAKHANIPSISAARSVSATWPPRALISHPKALAFYSSTKACGPRPWNDRFVGQARKDSVQVVFVREPIHSHACSTENDGPRAPRANRTPPCIRRLWCVESFGCACTRTTSSQVAIPWLHRGFFEFYSYRFSKPQIWNHVHSFSKTLLMLYSIGPCAPPTRCTSGPCSRQLQLN